MNHPPIVSHDAWQAARDALMVREKAHTRAGDALAAERRRLPMVRVRNDYVLQGGDGPVPFLDVFEGRRQLVVYHFMFPPGQTSPCLGCTHVAENLPRLEHLHARDVSLAMVSRAPVEELHAYRRRMGWTVPWYSSGDSGFAEEVNLSPYGADAFGLNVFLRVGDDVHRTYFTHGRGVESLGAVFSYMDLTPYGRQQEWEDSPPGWPQTETYAGWPARFDEYTADELAGRAVPHV